MKYLYITLALIFILGTLVIFNSRYPFRVFADEAWSIGYSVTKNPLRNITLNDSNILSYKKLNSITSEEIRFIADPFIVIEKDILYFFFEHQGINGNANIGLFKANFICYPRPNNLIMLFYSRQKTFHLNGK